MSSFDIFSTGASEVTGGTVLLVSSDKVTGPLSGGSSKSLLNSSYKQPCYSVSDMQVTKKKIN